MKTIGIGLCLAAAVVVFMAVKNMNVPSGLGVANGKLAPLPSSPNAVSSQVDGKDKRVEPLPFKKDLEETRKAVKKALNAHGSIFIHKEEETYIHAVSTTALMRYHDDIEFYFDTETRLVHFRSASRIGYSDMGLNRQRYNELARLYGR